MKLGLYGINYLAKHTWKSLLLSQYIKNNIVNKEEEAIDL